ncbi:MAG: SMP-30/gluconolactonase/LRE family protein, partial [Bacteroidia bacterium]
MIRNLITLLFISLFVSQFARAQDVSTLVTDSTKRFAAMHWHEDGRIYAVDYYNGNLYQVYLDGTVRTILDEFRNLAGGGFDHAGNFYFSDIAGGILYKLNADETYTSIATGMKQPVMILQDPQNDSILYITEYENSQVTRIVKETGAKSVVVKGRGINGPDGIFYDWDGNMMVSNWNNHKIHIVNPDG